MAADMAIVVVAYLLGSFSFGLFVARWYGQGNLRESGSGNIGATNVARTVGRTPALLTLLGDSAKGGAAVLLAQWWGASAIVAALAALAAVIGHMFPVYYRFQGGKGVATSLGVMIPLLPWPTLGGVVVWMAVALVLRYVSVASILAALVVPLLAFLRGDPSPFVLAASAAALLILGAHRANLQRLMQGTESRLR
jgi:glycerol-3-phosphate acyltransferase PlsY